MATTVTQTNAIADQARNLAGRTRGLHRDIIDFLKLNSVSGINWATPNATIVPTDTAGNIVGFPFSPSQMSNLIGTLQQFENLMTNVAITQGDHAANVYAVASGGSV